MLEEFNSVITKFYNRHKRGRTGYEANFCPRWGHDGASNPPKPQLSRADHTVDTAPVPGSNKVTGALRANNKWPKFSEQHSSINYTSMFVIVKPLSLPPSHH